MKIMSISQLVELGWSRTDLLQIANSKKSPAFKTGGGGKWMFDMSKLEKFIEERRKPHC
jgi:hypothetical protein